MISINRLIKSIFPASYIKFLRKIIFFKTVFDYYKYDAKRFIIHSNAINSLNNQEKLLGVIIAEYHVIEKGLTMPEFRPGFGLEKMRSLIFHCTLFSSGECCEISGQFSHALKVITEYKKVHELLSYTLDKELLLSIDLLLSKFSNTLSSSQLFMRKDEYFKFKESSFLQFSQSRHSVRNFEGSIDISRYEKAVCLAQNAPSACNRQPTRVYLIQSKDIISKVLSLQSGNRGFGYLADKLIILSAEIGGYLHVHERNTAYIDGGIYAMNLLYALHFYEIGACTLNWSSTIENDRKIRKICEINESETIILLIACGNVPDQFKLALSHRNTSAEILNIR